MSSWGTGVKQSDEFLDVYEEFFDLYKDDAAAQDVYLRILNEYLKEFSDEEESPILHTVYFALAQCLWECGCKDDALWQKVEQIIVSGADLKFWNELGADPQMEKSRQKQLLKFWDRINSAPKTVKKPKKTRKKREPTLHKGDLFAYSCGNGYRIAFVLDYVWESFLTAVSEDVLDTIPTEAEAMELHTHTVGWFAARASIPKKDRTVIASLELEGDYNGRAGLVRTAYMAGCSSFGQREWFFDLDKADVSMKRNRIGRYKLADLLNPEILPKYNQRAR